ncbi:MAG: hypothetical protein GY798_17330 [Hyphomicrobiales bacterium]|nr:hypothetical protein [Hyphomicrobiales bacterium]
MTQKSLIFAALLAATFCIGSAHAADDDWAGFYMGIDALDGSVGRMSIIPNGDGTFAIRVTAAAISMCADGPGSGAGWVSGTGRIVDGSLVRKDAMLTCDGAGEARPISDWTFTRDEDTGILTLGAGDDGRKLFYHRISGD